jgi:hypothetical protein
MVNIFSKTQEQKNNDHKLLLNTDHNTRFNPFIQSHVYSKGGDTKAPQPKKTTSKSAKQKDTILLKKQTPKKLEKKS